MKNIISIIFISIAISAFSTDLSKYKYIHELDSVYTTEYEIFEQRYSIFNEKQQKINSLVKDTLERYNHIANNEEVVNAALSKIQSKYPYSIKKLFNRVNQLEVEINTIKDNSIEETKEFDSWFESNSSQYNKMRSELSAEKKELDELQKKINLYESQAENALSAFEQSKKTYEKCISTGGSCSSEKAKMNDFKEKSITADKKAASLTPEFNQKAKKFNIKYQESLDLAKKVNAESNRRKQQLEVMLTQNTERIQIKSDEYEQGKKKLEAYNKKEIQKTLLSSVASQNKKDKAEIKEYEIEIAAIYGGLNIKHTLYKAASFFEDFKKEDFVYNVPQEVKDFWAAYDKLSNAPQKTTDIYNISKDLMNVLRKRTDLMEEMDRGDIFFACYMDDRLSKDQEYFLEQVMSASKIPSCHELSLANPELKRLKLYNRRIEDISLLEYFPNVEHLDIANNEVSDLMPITKLKKAKYLKLRNNKVEVNEIKEFCKELGMSKKTCVYK